MWQLKLNDHHWQWPAGQWLGISGPSGCGKTQLLTATACGRQGLLQCSQSPNLLSYPTHKRGLGWAVQGAPLWPNQTVHTMLATLAAQHGFDDWQAYARELHITPLQAQYTDTLSGGERQRVALLSAFMCAKHLLLLDEPVSALDANAAREALNCLRCWAHERQLAAIIVSHQWHDLASTCDWLYQWQSQTLCPISEAHKHHVLEQPDNAYALWPLDQPPGDGQVLVRGHSLECGPLPEATYRLRIDAHEVSIAREPPTPSSIANTLAVTINALNPVSDTSIIATLDWHGNELYALITPRAVQALALAAGQKAYAQFKAHGIRGA
ncbi:ATP-binding cassette domain-containing protein [Gilvimarinus agarilyticus]|uniref:ATP-binding cassette domain-containing protein n=1 Tax=Gilvimarinus agarilyticus TaxID=679259 RepID=UPI00059EDB84|nr:ATP-binding cassette domain-containing protein [Gilvimarinus agarilyticus]